MPLKSKILNIIFCFILRLDKNLWFLYDINTVNLDYQKAAGSPALV